MRFASVSVFVCWCFWSCLCACVCDDTCEFFCVAVYMLVYGWQALTEGHGSCTLSVWTLAEPLGVLFQARSDNLAPMTRLATAQFTGRSSTHAQPPPPPTPTSLPPLLPSSPLCSLCTLLHLSTLPSLFSQLLPISPFMLCFSQPLLLSLLSISITLLSTRQKLSAGILERQVLQTCQGDKMSLNTRRSNIFIRLVEWVPFVDNKMFLYTEVAVLGQQD